MSKWLYPTLDDCLHTVFPAIREVIYDESESYRPIYESQSEGLNNLDKTLVFVQNDEYYPDFYLKTAYLFLSITKGHYFSNGNKRLAAALTSFFLVVNQYEQTDKNERQVATWFKTNFPTYELDNSNFPIMNWALYHLNKAINDKVDLIVFDKLKNMVAQLFGLIFVQKVA